MIQGSYSAGVGMMQCERYVLVPVFRCYFEQRNGDSFICFSLFSRLMILTANILARFFGPYCIM